MSVLLISNPTKDTGLAVTRQAAAVLAGLGVPVLMPQPFANEFGSAGLTGVHFLPEADAYRAADQVVTIGGVAGGFGLNIDPFALIGGRSLTGVVVGSRAMTQSLVKFIDENALVPVIDSVFSFDQAANAYQRMEHGRPIGKVVIAID